jgi:hypothetical protein
MKTKYGNREEKITPHTAPLSVRVDYRSLAGIVQYLAMQKYPIRTRAGVVSAAVDICYATLIDAGKIMPIESIEQAFGILEVHGLPRQERENLGVRRTSLLASTETEELDKYAQVNRISLETAAKFKAAERSFKIPTIRKEPEIETRVETTTVPDPKPMPSAFAGIPPEILAQMARDEEDIRKEREEN